MPRPRPPRTYVVVALGWPVRGRRGYRALGTVCAACRSDASALLRLLDAAGAYPAPYPGAWGPVRAVAPAVAGTRPLAEALAADAR